MNVKSSDYKRYILTGTPGCGKTSVINALEMKGHFVIGEAATDVVTYEQMQGNTAPWLQSNFIDKIINLQKQRQLQGDLASPTLQFYDRSPLCTYALAVYLGFEPSVSLLEEIERMEKNEIYENRVFFIENLGFCKPTAARKISFEESLRFEKIHAETYEKFGYECTRIHLAPVLERMNLILRFV